MERCRFCEGVVDPATRRCQQCGRVQPGPVTGTPLGQSMQTRRWRRGRLKIELMILTVVLAGGLIGACALPWQQSPSSPNTGGGTATATPASPTNTPTLPTATPNPTPPQLALNAPASTDMAGLHIQTGGLGCPDQLVLKHQTYIYDKTAIQQMQTYLSAFGHATGNKLGANSYTDGIFVYTQKLAQQLPSVPDTLQWVPGGLYCAGDLDFTNTGTQGIQITSIGFTFDADAIPNSFAYQLIDLCSVLGQQLYPAGSCGCGGCGSSSPCTYDATLALQGGAAGTQVQGPIAASKGVGGSCPLPLTLDPTQPVVQTVHLHVNSALAQELYRVKLTVTITTATGTQVLALPSAFTSTLAYATAGQLSCYKLNGNTFTQEPVPIFEGLDPTFNAFPCV